MKAKSPTIRVRLKASAAIGVASPALSRTQLAGEGLGMAFKPLCGQKAEWMSKECALAAIGGP